MNKKLLGAFGGTLVGTFWWALCVYHRYKASFLWGIPTGIFCWLGYCLTRDKKERIFSEITDKIALELILISLSSLFLAPFGGHTLRMVLAMKDGLMEGTLRDIPHFWNNLLHLPSFVRNLGLETGCGLFALLAGSLPMLIHGSIQEEKRLARGVKEIREQIEEKHEKIEFFPSKDEWIVFAILLGIFGILLLIFFFISEKDFARAALLAGCFLLAFFIIFYYMKRSLQNRSFSLTMDENGILVSQPSKEKQYYLWAELTHCYELTDGKTSTLILATRSYTKTELRKLRKTGNSLSNQTIVLSVGLATRTPETIYLYERVKNKLTQYRSWL